MSMYRQWAAWFGCVLSVGALSLGCGGQPDLAIGTPQEGGAPPGTQPDASVPPTTMPPIILPDGAIVDVSVDPGVDCSQRITCTSGTTRYCGTIGDNCGGTLTCGDCPSGQVCRNNVCAPVFGDGCVPVTCRQPGGSYCGPIGDGGGAEASGGGRRGAGTHTGPRTRRQKS
jgi:hypothetical protein